MLSALVVALRSLALICGGHRAVALGHLALRQQLAVFKRTVKRPQLRHRDRLVWVDARAIQAPQGLAALTVPEDRLPACRRSS
jgi:hypothetical protein